MSELINKNDIRATIRWKLLTSASALALTAYVSTTALAKAEDASQPQIWIEFGGQFNRLDDKSEIFRPDLPASTPADSWSPDSFLNLSPHQKFEKPPLFGFDEEGKISFQPHDSDWIFSASIRYGRALKDKHVRQQSYPAGTRVNFYPTLPSFGLYLTKYPQAARFADTVVRNSEQHMILDFQAGKDVGLGLFGANSESTFSLGLRFAQFRDKSNIALRSDPDWHFQHKYYFLSSAGIMLGTVIQPFHSNVAGLTAERSFRGVGPSLSWNASTPFAGNPHDGELAIDWGLNVAALFGRQKTHTEHHKTARYRSGGLGFVGILGPNPYTLATVSHTAPPASDRSRTVMVPNVGGSVGLSWRLQDFKMSLGYRADFFFGAIDGGIDARKSENRGFFGPFASISVGMGD